MQSGAGVVAETAGEREGVGLGLGIVRMYVVPYDRLTDRQTHKPSTVITPLAHC